MTVHMVVATNMRHGSHGSHGGYSEPEVPLSRPQSVGMYLPLGMCLP